MKIPQKLMGFSPDFSERMKAGFSTMTESKHEGNFRNLRWHSGDTRDDYGMQIPPRISSSYGDGNVYLPTKLMTDEEDDIQVEKTPIDEEEYSVTPLGLDADPFHKNLYYCLL